MTTFYNKYKIDAEFAAEFITLGSCTTTLIEAFEAIDEDSELQACMLEEFGYTYDEVILDCLRELTTGTIDVQSPFAEETV